MRPLPPLMLRPQNPSDPLELLPNLQVRSLWKRRGIYLGIPLHIIPPRQKHPSNIRRDRPRAVVSHFQTVHLSPWRRMGLVSDGLRKAFFVLGDHVLLVSVGVDDAVDWGFGEGCVVHSG